METTVFTPYLPRLLIEWQCDWPSAIVRELDGSLVFVDISGFTKMSERLAKKGKVGSEEVAEVLNSTFTRLLAVAYENGGGLIKFGGDALLLFFSGTEHDSRAAHAAAGMRAKLRELGRIRTSAGLVQLRMSVGVHSGRFHFFLVGDSHRELIITGPAASKTVEMEHQATAGEILISEETASRIDSAVLGEERSGGVLLKRSPRPAAVAGTAMATGSGGIDLAEFVPAAIRTYLSGGGGEGEHRQATIAFVHFGGVDELLKTESPDRVAERLDALVRAVQAAVAEYEICFLGTDIDADGGKIILIAGAPRAYDNDEERILRVARMIVEADCGLALRIGVNRGHVFVGDIGPSYRRTFTVIGDAVNLAARLMQKATPGETLSTEEVLERSHTLFEMEALPPFLVKGKAQPVKAFRVGPVRGARKEMLDDSLPLVGRTEEMKQLVEALEEAKRGRVFLVELIGEAGIGKTRLIEELQSIIGREQLEHDLQGTGESCEFFLTRCEQYESSTPYFSFRRLLRILAGIDEDEDSKRAGESLAACVARIAPKLVPLLPLLAIPLDATVPGTPEADQIAPEFRSARMRQVVTDFIAARLPGASCIVFEDVHWMDDASADLLRHLVSTEGPTHSWLIGLTRRMEGDSLALPGEARMVAIALDHLDEREAVALAALASEELLIPEPQVEALASRSGGHPLFIKELVTASAAGGALDTLPDSVEALITSRIDRLDGPDRLALRQASVLGTTFSVELLAGISDAPEIRRPETWRRLAEFIAPAERGSYHFRQALFRDVAYEGLPYRRRRELHARAGVVLERLSGDVLEDQAELLSLHFHRAQAYEKAWRYSRTAGDGAKAKFANVEAATFFRRALESSRHVPNLARPDVAATWEALGDVCEVAGLYGESADAYRTARKILPASAAPRLMLKEGMIREKLGQYSQALRWFGRGISIATDLGDQTAADRVQLKLATAVARHRQGRYRACIDLCMKSVAEAEEIGDRAAQARAYYVLYSAYSDIGSKEAEKYSALALPIYEELGDLIGLGNVIGGLGLDAYNQSRWDEAMVLFQRSRELRERAGHVVFGALDANNAAEVLSDQGHLAEADEIFKEARRVWRGAHYSFGIWLSTSNIGRVAARDGRLQEAGEILSEALAGFHEIGMESFALETEARIAELLVFHGDHAEALEAATGALERAAQTGATSAVQAMLHRLQGYALLQGGDHVLAQDSFDESLHVARKTKSMFELALTLEGWGKLARLTGRNAQKYENEARAIFERLGVISTPAIPLPESL
jgi:class 3 adenylate cyclase/tetratricopeptide (TPR) repeat protein